MDKGKKQNSTEDNKAGKSANSNKSNKEESEVVKEKQEDEKKLKLFKKETPDTSGKCIIKSPTKEQVSPKKEQKLDKKKGKFAKEEKKIPKEESKPSKEDIEAEAAKEEKKARTKITPAMGRTRGPHPQSPSGNEILKLTSDLRREGYLARNPTGYIFLDLDDNWIFSVRLELEKFGYEIPPYFVGAQAVGANISLVPANIAKKNKKYEVEVGKKIEFKVVRAGPTFPTRRWYGAEAVYRIFVKSPELDKLCRKIAGPKYKPPGGFNIVVGVRKIEKRDEMIREMVVKKEEK